MAAFAVVGILASPIRSGNAAPSEVDLSAEPQKWADHMLSIPAPEAECFSIEVRLDPVRAEGGDLQVVSGIVVGAENSTSDVKDREASALTVDLREGADRSAFQLWNRSTNLTMTMPDPQPPGWVDTKEFQHPHMRAIREGSGHRIRLVVWPSGNGSLVRLFVDSMDRPAEEHQTEERIVAGTVKFFTMRGGQPGEPNQKSLFSDFEFKQLTPSDAEKLPPYWETVLREVDFSYPPMAPVGQAIQQRKIDEARSLFLRHMRNRNQPRGPTWEHVTDRVLHPDYTKISDAAVAGKYGTISFFDGFVEAWTDTDGDTHTWVLKDDPFQLNWSKDNGHLNRHFHWVSLAKAWDETRNNRYSGQFSSEVLDWVSREPFYWERTPIIGGLNIMDGTRFRWGYMNTSNIGRRLELTWWPAYEVFRKAPEFTEEAHFAMLVGMIRQAELITNPSSFAVHDDGAAHTTMALLQTALLLPEFKASGRWKSIALSRWDEMLSKQFHPDGTHVSLSTGYNWATILSLENFIRLHQQLGLEAPEKYFDLLEKALEYTLLLSTPNQSQIPQNDGGWSMIDDHFRRTLHWFPHREDFKWMATKGAEGTPPEQKSLYYPNAGHYFMRTGWGESEQYLFFGAGPWGASHGKQDALNIFTQFGEQLLIRDAGRGSYSAIGNTVHAGRSLSYNTLSPDWAQENSIPHWKTEMHIGFHPPERRWVNNTDFDYGEGSFNYGWHRPGEHIPGNWIRQVIFVKGDDPAKTGYYIAIDTVQFADEKLRTWRHPWQLNPDDIEIRESDKSIVATNSAAAIQILPVDPKGDMKVTKIQGQTDPELLGWRIYGEAAKEWPVPTYSWEANETFCRAWVIQMQANEEAWPITSVETLPTDRPGELKFKIARADGGTDHVIRRFPGSAPAILAGEKVEGDVVIISEDAEGKITAKLEITGGSDSVAAPDSF